MLKSDVDFGRSSREAIDCMVRFRVAVSVFLFACMGAVASCGIELAQGSFACEDDADCPKNWECYFDPEAQEKRCYLDAGLVPGASTDSAEGTAGSSDSETLDTARPLETDDGFFTDSEEDTASEPDTQEQDTGTGTWIDTGTQDTSADDTGTWADTGTEAGDDTDTFDEAEYDNVCDGTNECSFSCEKQTCSSLCRGQGACDMHCEKGECDMVCLEDERCSMRCEKASCTAQSHSSNRLEVRCEMPQSRCEVACLGEGECVIICEGGTCEFSHCPHPISCPNNVLVCNGTC